MDVEDEENNKIDVYVNVDGKEEKVRFVNIDSIFTDDPVHPDHYKIHDMECIDEMEIVFGREAVKAFCKLNAWKYRYRANEKGGDEDQKKADWYIQKLKELNER